MAISVADNFSYKGSKPLDARFQFSSVANMKNATTSDLYDGCWAYVTATKKYYSYDSSNTVDETTGKWREFEGGGGGSSYTAGDGIDITNNVISTDNMSSEDMDDVVTPLPGVMSRRMKYSTDEQVVGEWIDGKPLYQKTYTFTSASSAGWTTVATAPTNVDYIQIIACTVGGYSGGAEVDSGLCVFPYASSSSIEVYCSAAFVNRPGTITVQYTKTTN